MKISLFSAFFCMFVSFSSHATTVIENTPSSASINAVDQSTNKAGDIYQFANGCYAIYLVENNSYLSKLDQRYAFSSDEINASSKFYLRPSGLGTYLLYDQDKQYLIPDGEGLSFINKLESEMMLDMPEKEYLLSPAEWELHANTRQNQFYFKNIKSDAWLGQKGLHQDKNFAAKLALKSTQGCAKFPESETGTSGIVSKVQHDDGTLWGFVDAHEHSTANHGFGGKIFHGSSFHKLGIEHALADCEKHHGKDGSKDLMSITYKSGSGNITIRKFAENLFSHLVSDKPDHDTDGYPTLSQWKVHETPTHQSLYYKWIERAYLGGMRIMVEYLESTEVVCEVYKDLLPGKSESETCNEMAHVDHQLIKMKELQNYVDAQAGGPGKGWLRIVYSPEEAREVIKAGKLAIILGIEIENPLDCFLDEREGFPACDADIVRSRLNNYYQKGIRALFPSHKFVNSFSSGDGDAGILEVGDYLNSGQWRDYVACDEVPGEFWMNSHGEGKERSMFSRLANVSGIPMFNDMLSGEAVGTPKQVLPLYSTAATHCQKDGFTPLGHALINEMMALGMIIDLGHTPKAALNDILPVLVKNDYPAVHTHGGDQAAINLIKGLATRGLGSACRDKEGDSGLLSSFKEISSQVDPETGLPRKGLSYDFNGFAGYNRPRFGELSRCEITQNDPLEYPFTSFGGDIVFEKLQTGDQVFDFNQDGLANIGLYPDLIEEARRGGASKEEIGALFKTAETYIRIWEKAVDKTTKPKQLLITRNKD